MAKKSPPQPNSTCFMIVLLKYFDLLGRLTIRYGALHKFRYNLVRVKNPNKRNPKLQYK